jgi:uncharacterized membrane protein
MAGIGFRLQKLVDHGSYTYSLRGFFFATFLVAGPWITTVVTISLFSWLSTTSGSDYGIFRTSIIYFYAFSLIFTGLYQMPLTRYLADELYEERLSAVVPAYLAMTIIVAAGQGLIAVAYASFIPLSLFFKALFVSGCVVVALLWLAGIFLSCLRDFEYIGYIYIFGGLISLAAGIHLEPIWGLEGALTGFITGQVITFIGISWRIIVELGVGRMRVDFACLQSLRNYPTHLFTGLFFNLAIWVDKFIIWFSDYGQTAVNGLYYFQAYDVPLFIAYVFMIPGLGIFLTRVETDFYRSYRAFYRSILMHRNFRTIVNRFDAIGRTINYTTWELLRIQGAIAVVIFFFAPEFLQKINYAPEFATVLRWGIMGAFFQLLFLVFSLMLLYFEFRKEAMWCNFIFFFVNSVVTGLTVWLKYREWLGAGYCLSTLIAATVSWFLLKARTRKLIYYTFMTQKMPKEINEQPEFIVRSLGSTVFTANREKSDPVPSR